MYKYWVIFLIVINLANAQWENITLDIKSANLKDILVIDSNLIVSCGDNGVIKTTKDAGTSWISFKIDKLSRQLTALAKNENNVFIAGNAGALLMSNLSADKWDILELDKKNNFSDITFFENYGAIIGENGLLLLSTDKGNSWNETKIIIDGTEIEVNLLKATFNKSGKLVITGKNGLLVFSVDFGNSFKRLDLSFNDNLTALTENEDGTFLVGTDNAKLMRIDSTLENFNFITSNNLPHSFYSLKTIGDSVIIAGAVYNLDLVQTISYDNGKTWLFSNTYGAFAYGISNYFNQIYLCMNNGFIFKLDNIKKLYSNNFQYLGEAIEGGNPKITYQKVSGNNKDKLISFDGKNIYQTLSNKIEWKKIFELDRPGYNLRDVQFTSDGNIISLIDSQYYANGTDHYFPKIIKILNENTFEITFESLREMLIDKLNVSQTSKFVSAHGNLNILVSTNNGNRFDSIIVPDIKSFSRISGGITSEKMLYFVGIDKSSNYFLFKTYDLQNIEKIQLPSKIKSVYFINREIGYNLNFEYNENQYISRTTDGGINFNVIMSYKLNGLNMLKDISFADNNNGAVCGQQGVVYYTDNGGNNWYNINNSETMMALKIYFPNKNELYVSDGQNIYKYIGELPVSVKENDNANKSTEHFLFPNPASDYIKFSSISEGAVSYEIYNILGIKQLEGVIENEINIELLPKGIYFLKLNNNNKVIKFIKE